MNTVTATTTATAPKYSPWGQIDHSRELASGIFNVSTPGHGGYWLSPARRAKLPSVAFKRNFLKDAAWWEEDCDWCVPFLFFHEEIKPFYASVGYDFGAALDAAKHTAEQYHPEFYAEWLKSSSQVSLFAAAAQ